MPFEPLLSTCRDLGSHHVSLFGSAVRSPLSEVADVDLHLVIPRVDRSAFAALVAAAEETTRGLAARAERPWCVETRHGPFKPPPGDAPGLQLHLLIDDDVSVESLPCALIAHRAATGRLLAGAPLTGRRAGWNSQVTWLREARTESTRWRDALVSREIAFRSWELDPEPRLVERRTPAATAWELRCLLRGAATASDLHYRAALLVTRQAADDLARPLLAQIGEEPAWRELEPAWARLRGQAISVIERRLNHLSAAPLG